MVFHFLVSVFPFHDSSHGARSNDRDSYEPCVLLSEGNLRTTWGNVVCTWRGWGLCPHLCLHLSKAATTEVCVKELRRTDVMCKEGLLTGSVKWHWLRKMRFESLSSLARRNQWHPEWSRTVTHIRRLICHYFYHRDHSGSPLSFEGFLRPDYFPVTVFDQTTSPWTCVFRDDPSRTIDLVSPF